MTKYIFKNFGEEEEDSDFTKKINEIVKDGYAVVSHCTDRYWGLTVIFKKL